MNLKIKLAIFDLSPAPLDETTLALEDTRQAIEKIVSERVVSAKGIKREGDRFWLRLTDGTTLLVQNISRKDFTTVLKASRPNFEMDIVAIQKANSDFRQGLGDRAAFLDSSAKLQT